MRKWGGWHLNEEGSEKLILIKYLILKYAYIYIFRCVASGINYILWLRFGFLTHSLIYGQRLYDDDWDNKQE